MTEEAQATEVVDQEATAEVPAQEEQSAKEPEFDPKKRYDVNDDPRLLVEKIKYKDRQVKASDARNKLYWDAIQKLNERLDQFETKTTQSEYSQSENVLLTQLQEARDNGDIAKETKLLGELVDLRVQQKIEKEKPAKQAKIDPEIQALVGDPDVQTIAERMHEKDASGELLRPWMNQNHPKYNYVEAQLNSILVRQETEQGWYDMDKALDELDQIMMKPTKSAKPAPKPGPDPMGGSNLTNSQQRAKMKLSPQEEAMAYKLGLTPDAYLNGKRRTGQIK